MYAKGSLLIDSEKEAFVSMVACGICGTRMRA